MYKYEQIQLDVKKEKFMTEFPLDTFKQEGVPKNISQLEDVIVKHRAYINYVMRFCEEHQGVTDIYNTYEKGTLAPHVVYTENLRQEISDILLMSPDTTSEIRKTLISLPHIWNILGSLLQNNYENLIKNYLDPLSEYGEIKITKGEKQFLISELESATQPFDYDESETFKAKHEKLFEIIEKMNEDREEDFDYRILWNKRFYKKILTRKEIDQIYKSVLPHISNEQIIELDKNVSEQKRAFVLYMFGQRNYSETLVREPITNGQELIKYIKKHRTIPARRK